MSSRANQLNGFRVPFLPCAVVVLLLASCGGSKRPPPPPSLDSGRSVPTSTRKPAAKSPPGEASVVERPVRLKDSPRARVLLRSGFQSARIEGAGLAPVVLVRVGKGEISLKTGQGKGLGSSSGFRLEPAKGKLLKLDGQPYRGAIETFINPLKQPVVVNEVTLEAYLKGVVPNELSPKAFPHLEALKAQAVAARTFALAHLRENAARGFDLYADERSQVYRGVPSEQELTNRAVEATRGMVAIHDNQPIVAFYSSTCGGITEDYGLIFSRPPIPYLRGGVQCPDQSSPYRSWNDHIQIPRREATLNRRVRVGKLKSVKPLRRSSAGRLLEMRFVGERGEKVLKGLDIRAALGLKSNWVTVLDPRYDRSGYMVELRVEGRGLGHGVGMCQTGAVELAKRGWSHSRILKHYYKGIQLEHRW